MEKNYNYQRKKLLLPEYGRHIHQMIDYLMTIQERELRNRQARAVIAVMGNLYPHLRDTPDNTHMLWDHLFLMSGFQLDVDSPYPIPTAASLAPRPKKPPYPYKNIRFKHYGKNIQNMIRALEGIDDQQAVEQEIGNIARYMRAKSYEYNQEHPDNAVIIKDIKTMSEHGITVDEIAISNLKSDYKQQTQQRTHPKKGGHQNRNAKNGKNNKNGLRQNNTRKTRG